MGCQQGLAFADPAPGAFSPYRKSSVSGDIIRHAYYILPDSDTSIYVCAEDGLYLVNPQNDRISALKTGQPFFYIFRDINGVLLASSTVGTWPVFANKISAGDFINDFSSLQPLIINSHITLNDSIMVLGTQNKRGLYIWNRKTHKIRNLTTNSKPNSIPDNIINTIRADKEGNMWILADNAVSVINPKNWEINTLPLINPATGASYSIFFDICESSSNYFITSYGNGILVLDKQYRYSKILTTNTGLANNGTYRLFCSGDTLLFASTNNGLSVIGLQNWSVRNFYQESGLHANTFEEFSGNNYQGKFYAGGKDGFTVINPALIRTNLEVPGIFINNIFLRTASNYKEVATLPVEKIYIASSVIEVTISVSVINYVNPKKTRLYYRNVNKYENWKELYNNTLHLANVRPGKYFIEFKAINEHGVEGTTQTLTLIFLPKWYQTLFFKILVGLAIFALAWAFYRLRINQLKKEQRIRTKLASDLHDDLGSTMNSVKLYANLAIMEYPNGKYPPLIKESTQEAITGIRDMIWVLDDSKDSIEDLLTRISNFANPLCDANHVQYIQGFSEEARNHKLGQEERRNLYMMLKETINNAIKYAGGSTITVTATVRKGKPAFSISDNGKGFDTTLASEGNGLKNLQRRSAEIKYRLHLESAPGTGTSIRIEKE
jgi:signal transduction histidine kinase